MRAQTKRRTAAFGRRGLLAAAAVLCLLVVPLWRVAAHLCRDRHDAEDAVQSSFLSAIESKDAWDGERPLLPYPEPTSKTPEGTAGAAKAQKLFPEGKARRLSAIEMPKLIEIRAELPRTAVGKLSKKELKAELVQQGSRA